jgi:hypothetical protein
LSEKIHLWRIGVGVYDSPYDLFVGFKVHEGEKKEGSDLSEQIIVPYLLCQVSVGGSVGEPKRKRANSWDGYDLENRDLGVELCRRHKLQHRNLTLSNPRIVEVLI